MIAIVLLGLFAVGLSLIGYLLIIRPLQREARAYSDAACIMRNMRDEAREEGRDFYTEAKIAKDIW